jgi:hypothetical protein
MSLYCESAKQKWLLAGPCIWFERNSREIRIRPARALIDEHSSEAPMNYFLLRWMRLVSSLGSKRAQTWPQFVQA